MRKFLFLQMLNKKRLPIMAVFFLLWHNPAKNTLFVDLKENSNVIASEAWLSYQTDNSRYNRVSINISSLQKGIYIIKVENEVAKFVKE